MTRAVTLTFTEARVIDVVQIARQTNGVEKILESGFLTDGIAKGRQAQEIKRAFALLHGSIPSGSNEDCERSPAWRQSKQSKIQIALIFSLEEFRHGERDPEISDRCGAGSIGDPPRSMVFKSIAEGRPARGTQRPSRFHPARYRQRPQ